MDLCLYMCLYTYIHNYVVCPHWQTSLWGSKGIRGGDGGRGLWTPKIDTATQLFLKYP